MGEVVTPERNCFVNYLIYKTKSMCGKPPVLFIIVFLFYFLKTNAMEKYMKMKAERDADPNIKEK